MKHKWVGGKTNSPMEADEWIRYCNECGTEMNEDNEKEDCPDDDCLQVEA